jgi:hypothetical protein
VAGVAETGLSLDFVLLLALLLISAVAMAAAIPGIVALGRARSHVQRALAFQSAFLAGGGLTAGLTLLVLALPGERSWGSVCVAAGLWLLLLMYGFSGISEFFGRIPSDRKAAGS